MATVLDSRPLAASQDIQGNVLAPYRSQHQAFLFLSFRNQRNLTRRWLADAAKRVSSTADVVAATCHHGGADVRSDLSWMNLGLTVRSTSSTAVMCP